MKHYKTYALVAVGALMICAACYNLWAKDKHEAAKTTKQHTTQHMAAHAQKLEGLESHNAVKEWAQIAEQITTGIDPNGTLLTTDQIKNLIAQNDALAITVVTKIQGSKNKEHEETQVLNEIKAFLHNMIAKLQEEIKQAHPDADKEHVTLLNKEITRFQEGLQELEKNGLKGLFFDKSKYPTAAQAQK